MADATLTGLLPSVTITLKKTKKKPMPRLDFQTCIKPVVLEVKPFSTYFNPFGAGCSVLCNHPVETDFRPFSSPPFRHHIRKASKRREEKKAAVRRGEKLVEKMGRHVGGMLERLGATSEFSNRKCVTPSAGHRPTLVLDLRRAQSSDNLAHAAHTGGVEGKQSAASLVSAATASSAQTLSRTPFPATKEEVEGGDDGKDDEVPRRRGRKVKKKKKSSQDKSSKQQSVGLLEPSETQISTFSEGLATHVEASEDIERENGGMAKDSNYIPPHCSIFDLATLRHLRRNMTKMDAQSEYSKVWRRVLAEAVRGSVDKHDHMYENNDSTDPDQWINLPRLFSLASARFQLPLDRNTLNNMEPLEYLRDHVFVAKGKKMLYNHVFIKYSSGSVGGKPPSHISTKMLWEALGEVAGGGLDQAKRDQLWQYLDWDIEEGSIDLLTWYGLCAFTERIIGKEKGGRSHVEEADFELLPRILSTVKPTSKLIDLLKAIHSIGESNSVTTSPDLWKNLLHLQLSYNASVETL